MPSLFLGIDSLIFASRPLKPLPQRNNHFPEPVKVQDTQRRIANNIRHREPRRYRQASGRLSRSPDVLIHLHGLIRAPNQATGSERRDERDAIDELRRRSSHAKLIHEPVDIEKWRRQLIQNEI